MSARYSPASVRSLKAKFRTLLKPSIWTSAVGVSLMLVLGWQSVNYLTNQENAATEEESVTETPELADTLSSEESQIAADIESSDVLQELFEQEPSAIPTPIANTRSDRDEPRGLFDRVAAEGIDTADVLDRFSVGAPSRRIAPQNSSGGTPLGNWSSNTSTLETDESDSESSNAYTSPVLPNVLQAAIDRANANPAASGSTTSVEATPSPSGLISPAPTASETSSIAPTVAQRWDQQFINSGQPQPTLPTGTNSGFSQGTSAPQSPYSSRSGSSLIDLKRSSSVVPAPTQTNGYATPDLGGTGNLPTATPVTPGSYNNDTPSFNNFPTTTAQPTVPYADPYRVTDPYSSSANNLQGFEQQQAEPLPSFALDTPIPGRYIGGGEINTFANP